MNRTGKAIKKALSALVSSGVNGHALPRNPVPLDQMSQAELIGIKGVRTWGDQYSQLFQDDIVESVRQEHEGDFPPKPDGCTCYNVLALSGGGAHGAFGAGFLYGWTQQGSRPRFKLVTGISTGALIAPLAFLGPEYDEELKEMFTTIKAKNVFRVRNFISWLWNESFADTGPLVKLIEKYADAAALEAIARAHANGRRLYMGTTSLDAESLVVWNMGAIASSTHPDALKLFRKVVLASVSIPGAFPPVYFDVEAAGRVYDEMHVDGGTITEVFFHGSMLDLPAARKEVFGEKTPKATSALYIIRNGKLTSSPEQVPRSLQRITRRALSTLSKAHGWDHLYHIYDVTQRNQIDFNYIDIPADCVLPDRLTFDPEEMNRLFDLGVELAKSGDKWHKFPPNLHESHQSQRTKK